MDKEKLFAQIKGGLIVSCQALEHEPLYTKEGGVMPLMAKAAAMSGAVGIRANTVRDITQIKQVVDLPVIGIIKKDYPGTPMYITVTMKEVDELVACGVDILAVQGTGALRPDGSTSAQFIRAIKAKYPEQLVMADCDNLENAMLCAEAGADFVGTTMRGYTPENHRQEEQVHCDYSGPKALMVVHLEVVEQNIRHTSKARFRMQGIWKTVQAKWRQDRMWKKSKKRHCRK